MAKLRFLGLFLLFWKNTLSSAWRKTLVWLTLQIIMRQNPNMKNCPHKLLYWVRSHMLKIKVDSLTGLFCSEIPWGILTFNIFSDVLIAKWVDSVISALYPAWSLILGSVNLTIPRNQIWHKVGYCPKPDSPKTFLGEEDEEEGMGKSAWVRSMMNSTKHRRWFVTFLSSTTKQQVGPTS